MAQWADYLRETTVQLGGAVVDADGELGQVVDMVCSHGLALLDRAPN